MTNDLADAGTRPDMLNLFAYGTLKRGECREQLWPHPPVAISEGFIQGKLYDLGPYPAVRVDIDDEVSEADHDGGWEWVQGELWSIAPEHAAATLKTLDDIEGTNQAGQRNLYDQVRVRVYKYPGSHESQLALVYQYSQAARLKPQRRMRPQQRWTETQQAAPQESSLPKNWREYTVSWSGRDRV